jgi:hypothetical protein
MPQSPHHRPPLKKVYSPASSVPPPSHPTSCTLTKSNLYFIALLIRTLVNLPYINFLRSRCQFSYLHFCCLGRLSTESVQILGSFKIFVTILFYCERLFAPPPTPKLEDHPQSAVRCCVYNIFAATLHS